MHDSLNVRPYNNKELLLFPPSVGDYLPKDHLAHVVDEAVDEIDLTPYYRKIAEVGNPSYHPALMVKIWFYGYATKTYSSRKIEDKLHTDIAFIYLSGMQKPDFKTIAEFRRNNLEELKNSFVDILQICHRLGMTKLGEISLDSKVMKANASAQRTYDEKQLAKEREELEKTITDYLEKVNQTDCQEDEKYGADKRGDELPNEIGEKKERIKKLKQVAETLRQAQTKLKQTAKEKVNLTDSDAQFQKDKSRILPGYRAQIAVDAKNQVIVAQDVTNDQCDVSQLIPMVQEILKNAEKLQLERQKVPIKLSADGGYHSGQNLAELAKQQYREKIDPYIPDTNLTTQKQASEDNANSPFPRARFTYNEKENGFSCPEGKRLDYVKQRVCDGVRYSVYKANRQDCKSCRHFGKCTIDKSGRSLWVSEYQPFIDRMREKLSTKEGRDIYGKRKITAEPVIGNLSYNLGFKEFLLRGVYKVRGEFSLMCIAHNLLKIAKFIRELGKSLKEALGSREVLWGEGIP